MKYWKLSDYFLVVSANRIILQRIFFSLALLSLVIDYWQGMLISQIGTNPVLNQDVDPVYLLFMFAGIPQFISGNVAPFFDALVVAACLGSILLPRSKVFPGLFLAAYFIYFIVSNMLTGHHYTNIGVLVMAIPFVFSSEYRFATVFGLGRFFLCFMMVSAACWKIARGNLWHVDQTHAMLVTTYLDELATGGTSAGMRLVKWLVINKSPAHIIWVCLILLESIFVIGFISFKWDKWLLAAYLLFFAGGWIIFRIYNFENLLFLLTLCPVLHSINRLKGSHKSKSIQSKSI